MIKGSVAFAALTFAQYPLSLFGGPAAEEGGVLIPFLDAQPPVKRDMIVATTTSTQDAGLMDLLIPAFERESGYRIKLIAVGTGQALAMGARGDADVVLCHAPELERKYVAAGVFVKIKA